MVFLSAVEKIRWKMLRSDYLREVGKFYEAYTLLCRITQAELYGSEEDGLMLKKAYLLFLMGDYKKADLLLGKVKHTENSSVWELRGILAEQDGNIAEAARCMDKARLLLHDNELPATLRRKISVYNNCGRILLIQGNRDEALHYYQLSADAARKTACKSFCHVPYQNLIHLKTLDSSCDTKSIEKLIEEYRNQVTADSVNNFLEFYSFFLGYYRQKNEPQKVFDIIREGYARLKGMLTNVLNSGDKDAITRKCVLQANVFRMLMNATMDVRWLMVDINETMDVYFKLPLPEKLHVLKPILGKGVYAFVHANGHRYQVY